jgi:chromosomal replication initiator protein
MAETVATLGTTSLQNGAACTGGHTVAKAVFTGFLAIVGLKGALHGASSWARAPTKMRADRTSKDHRLERRRPQLQHGQSQSLTTCEYVWTLRPTADFSLSTEPATFISPTDSPWVRVHTLWILLWRGELAVSDHEALWNATSQLLKAQVSEGVWYSTFNDVVALASDDDSLRIQVPNAHVRDRIVTRYRPLVLDALDEIGESDRELIVEIGAMNSSIITVDTDDSAVATTAADSTETATKASNGKGLVVGLNPRYTFDNFVKGASNQFALAAALRVAETPARSYNPLFIYGSAGLGKTHLLQAIGWYVHDHYAHYEVRYVSTETFLNEYVDAIRTNTTAAFKRRYRDVDVLLIDDIQFMEGKEGLQEEFFHTFNSLHGANKQIVISSDRMPDAIPTLEDRLRGRFRWGLITDIQPPDLETRLAILRNKAERDNTPLDAEVLEFIASNITSNIRELEGALIRVTAYANLTREPATVEMAKAQLGDLLSESAPKHRTDEEMLAEMAAILGFSVEALKGKSRQRPLVAARQISMYVFRDMTELSYPAIARLFGGRDHTTVIHAVEKTQRLMRENKETYDQVTSIITQLKSS